MSATATRIASLAVLLLLILAVLFLALRGLGVPIAVGPLRSPTPLPLPSPSAAGSLPSALPSGSAAPSASGDAVAAFTRIEGQVRELRGLPDPGIGPPEIIGRDQLEEELRAQFAKDYPEERQRADNITLRALGLLTQDQDVAALQLQLLSAQVIGFYDDTKQRMVVVSDEGVTPVAQITYAHEYTHALQDGAFGLSKLELDAVGEDDRSLARLGLVEGDATLSMVLWVTRDAPELVPDIAETPIPDMSGIPPWMIAQLQFPYEAGAQFTSQLFASGGFDAVDAAYDDPPASTEQVLHPQAYLDGEEPIAVDELDLAGALDDAGVGAGDWRAVESTALGEAMIGITLEGLGAEHADALDAGSGWGGDRLTVATDADGAFALAWRIVFDAPADSNDFERTYNEVVAALPFPARLTRLDDRSLLVTHASDAAILDATTTAAGG